jgi:ribosome-binding factor A
MKHRIERVCEVIKRELGSIIGRELTFSAPLVTVSAVDVTPDLKQAHVYVSALGSEGQKRKALETLELAKRIVLKHTPHLHFKFDESIERGTRVLGILDELGLDEKT